jgi:hypothetical protein
MERETMQPDAHISDQELVMATDGELPEIRLNEVRAHLASCWACRTRMRELDDAIADFVRIQRQSGSQLPPADGPRALLRARLAELQTEPPPFAWQSLFGFSRTQLGMAGVAVLLLAIAGLTISLRELPRGSARAREEDARQIPDSRLTPGAVLLVSASDVCATEPAGKSRYVPAAVAQKVFEEYGISSPQPRAYELDYLVAPELGGSDDIRNFWPQPYSATVWNSHLKDALEDRLHELVCSDQLSLATAQHDIAANWVSAYKHYFKTETPLPDHYAFAKDRPW